MKIRQDVMSIGIMVEVVVVLCLLPLAARAPASSVAADTPAPDQAPPAPAGAIGEETLPPPKPSRRPQAVSMPAAPTTPATASPPSSAVPVTKIMRMRVTAYCPCARCCGRWADGITASGLPVTHNDGWFVAAPRAMAFGTLIRIPGYANGQAVPVTDRGGSITSGRLDVYFPSHRQALQWGVRMLDVEILLPTD